MNYKSYSLFLAGGIILILTIYNAISADIITPSFQRAEVLSSISAVIFIFIGTIFQKLEKPEYPIITIKGEQGLFIKSNISNELKSELAWSSLFLIKGSAAISIYLYWKGEKFLNRGILTLDSFNPGIICNRSMQTKEIIYIPNTKRFNASAEFDSFLKNVPSILISPISNDGFILLGADKIEGFDDKDRFWLEAITEKMTNLLSSFSV